MSDPEIILLKELLAAGDRYVSGSLLAEKLNISRVSIWSQMGKLRAAGFDFDARPRLGYRLREMPANLNPLLLRTLLPEEWQAVPLHFHETIDSTNSEAERLLASGSVAPFVVLAREQTAGRGRLGRPWFSADAGNVYLSFVFQPRLPPQRMQTFTLWMGVALCDFLNHSENIPVRIKWPNDLLLDGKKLGGMLTEARVDSDRIRDLVFGLGLNVNGRTDDLPPELQRIATSLAAGAGKPLCLNRFTAALVTRVLESYRDFTGASPEASLQRKWPLYDVLAGRPVTTRQGTERLGGIARGIDEQGSLLLEQPDASIRRVNAGDVTLEKESEA